MATIRLVPSTYYLSNSSYLSVSNANNMYDNTDSTNYATVTNSRTSTSSYYIYVRGFNFDDIPSNAIINSFTVKIKCNYSGGYAQAMYLYNGTSTSYGSSDSISSSVTTHEFSCSRSFDDLRNAGSNFGIRINCRRASRNTTSYVYIYGAEIEVDYTIPTPRTVTTSLSGSGTIDPSGTNTYYDGDEFELIVEPTDQSAEVSATMNGSSITLTKHTGGETTEQNVLGTFDLISGGFNSGQSWFEGIVGQGYDTDNKTTSNYYSSGSGTKCIFTYDVGFTGIPNDATIKSLYMMVNGHAESTSNSNEYMCVQLKSGDTELSAQYNFKSAGTSNTTQTILANVVPTIEQLENLVIECTLGYYGGAINGATVFLSYEVSGVYYTWSTTISGDMTIAVQIGGSTTALYVKLNGSWTKVTKAFKKVNGSWVEQDITTLFNSQTNYRRG